MTRKSDEMRYFNACHAMQTGVKYEMGREGTDGPSSPKHLRVGVNSAMVTHAALVALLIQKGILTEDEYVKSQADAMETEVSRYEERANREAGANTQVIHFR